jgi:hypothetical protein
MNHYCLCCAHCPKYIKFDWVLSDEDDDLVTLHYGHCQKGIEVTFESLFVKLYANMCLFYTPRPEPQLTYCIEVLKMLGVEVE